MKQKDPIINKQTESYVENNSGRDTREASKARTGSIYSISFLFVRVYEFFFF
jgi:hypothetical protein